jgi:NADP-dependent 3-hydroxy acid dehydrogenase YdfG
VNPLPRLFRAVLPAMIARRSGKILVMGSALGRLVGARKDAEFAAYLCSEPASCFVGQVFPVCGGWVVR